jgi:hypothetical protein
MISYSIMPGTRPPGLDEEERRGRGRRRTGRTLAVEADLAGPSGTTVIPALVEQDLPDTPYTQAP